MSTSSTDELIGTVVAAVRPDRPQGYGSAWEALCANHDRINKWVKDGLTVVKIGDLLARQGVVVPPRTLHRYCAERTEYRGRGGTVPVVDGEPGVECQIDFARMGMVFDSATGRRRVVHALIFTAVFSRHMFVWLTFSQTLEAVIDGCEAAWRFFGGVFKVLVPDNMSTIVAHADSVNPRFTVGWLEYAQARGFATDPARVAHPQDKPRVERMVQYVRNNFFAGEDFADLADAQARAEIWCADKAGQRIHGTTCARPAVVFAEQEAALLLTGPQSLYAVPVYAEVKVHRDYHLLTELIPMFRHVSAVSRLNERFYGRCRVRRLRGRSGSVGVGGSGGGVAVGDGLEVGAVSVARPGGATGRGGRCVLQRPARGRAQRGHGPLVRDGPAALVPVPVGDRGGVGPRDPFGGPRFLPMACDHERPEGFWSVRDRQRRIRCRCGCTAKRCCAASTTFTATSVPARW